MSDRNAYLAEHLFGLRLSDGIRYRGIVLDDAGRPLMDIPDYENTWEGAGLVFEAMRERGYFFVLSYVRPHGTRSAPECHALFHHDAHGSFEEAGDTLPQAVTAAACAALATEQGGRE